MSIVADPSDERAAEEFEMVKVALSIRLGAIPGKEKEVEQFLLAGRVGGETAGMRSTP